MKELMEQLAANALCAALTAILLWGGLRLWSAAAPGPFAVWLVVFAAYDATAVLVGLVATRFGR